uniref:Pentraxin (PTX) domain-containing protein n=1 Tax=Monopterus albus TaxID=43700 RepID=A0A3Q3JHL2_MONAL
MSSRSSTLLVERSTAIEFFLKSSSVCGFFTICGNSADSARTSLWGKKVLFDVRPCLWQLHPDAVIPALKELSVCILLRRKIATPWTGFVYKAPGGRDKTELGLGGVGSHLAVWLFGEEHRVERELLLKEWHSVCLTWSGQTQRLRIYINGTCLNDTYVNPILPQQLAQNGTLTLGVSHYVDANDKVQQESSTNLLGEIGLFRIWAREWGPEELRNQSCADGDVVSWDQLQWKYSCPAFSQFHITRHYTLCYLVSRKLKEKV